MGLAALALVAAGEVRCAVAQLPSRAVPPAGQRATVNGLSPPFNGPIRLAQQPEMVRPFRGPGSGGPAPAPDDELPVQPGTPFLPGQFRLPLLGATAPAGTTPRPTPEVLDRFDEFIERTVDPENTLDLVTERPRLMVFKQAPLRVQIADEKIASYMLISENEISVVGNDVGSTVLNLWFADPANPNQPRILWVNLGLTLGEQERFQESYEAFAKVLGPAAAHSNVGVLLAGCDRRAEAKAAFEKALSLQPQLPQAQEFLAYLNHPQ
jgi:hypothetical protein